MILRRSPLLACVAAMGLCVVPGPATTSAAPGVHIDPSSPAGREYAIPLEATRREFSGSDTPAASGTRPRGGGGGGGGSQTSAGAANAKPTLFGAGVARPRRAARPSGRAARRATPPTAALPAPAALRTIKADRALAPELQLGGIVGLMLLAALGLAVLTRRRTDS